MEKLLCYLSLLYYKIISSASVLLFLPDIIRNFPGRKQYFSQIWKIMINHSMAHFPEIA